MIFNCYHEESATNSSLSMYFWRGCEGHVFGGLSGGLLILFTTYVAEFLLGMPSNIWLMVDIFRNRSKVSGILPADFFPFHLGLAQLSFYTILPVAFANHFLWRNNIVMNVCDFVKTTMLTIKPLLHCLICVERYVAVVRPLLYLRCRARRFRLSFLCASWCIYILIALLETYGCAAEVVFVVFLIVLIVNTSCSVAVLKTLKRPAPGDGEMAEKDGRIKTYRGKRENNSLKRKAFNTIVIIQTVLFFNYLPTILCFPLIDLVSPFAFKCQCLAIALASSISCGYLQPLLRLYKLGRLPFRKSSNT